MPAPSQNRLMVTTLEHFVLPFFKSYKADGDIPPLSEASHTFDPFSAQISFILLIMASFIFMIVSSSRFVEFHNHYMFNIKFYLVELHDIDIFLYLV